MNPYLEPEGFLGTGASLLADVTLLAYLLLILPAMIGGYLLARRGLHRPHHKWLMIAVTAVNWVLIFVLMLVAYTFDVIHHIGAQPGNARYLLPTLHGALGLPAQLLATFIVIRMLIEDDHVARAKERGERNLSRYWFRGARWTMRLTLVLWLATSALGLLSYLVRHNVFNTTPAPAIPEAPAATAEAGPPEIEGLTLQELFGPLVSAEPDGITLRELLGPLATAEVSRPATTPEAVAPVVTEETDSRRERGRGRGRGRGGDDEPDDDD